MTVNLDEWNARLNKFILSLLLLALFCSAGLLSSCSGNWQYDNTHTADDLVDHYLSVEEYNSFYVNLEEDNISRMRAFGNINEIAEKFPIECVRNPQEYNACYAPYAVFINEMHSTRYVFFDPESGDILLISTIDHIPTYSEALETVKLMADGKCVIDDDNSLSASSLCLYYSARTKYETLVTQDGMFILQLGPAAYSNDGLRYYTLESYYYYTDEEILKENADIEEMFGIDLFPLLPIDKAAA